MIADSFGEGDSFALAAEAGEIGGGVEMVHAFDFLFDNGSGVEFRGYVVAGCADDFYAALVCLLVWFCADECGEKRVVDVDDFS